VIEAKSHTAEVKRPARRPGKYFEILHMYNVYNI
jgi:hypothetical protein